MVREGEALTAGPAKGPGEEGGFSPASGGSWIGLVQTLSPGKSRPSCSLVVWALWQQWVLCGVFIWLPCGPQPSSEDRDANTLLTTSRADLQRKPPSLTEVGARLLLPVHTACL